MALFQRHASGSLARKTWVEGIAGLPASALWRGSNGTCCCTRQLWWMLVPCGNEPPYWWDCNSSTPEAEWSGCRWITWEKVLDFWGRCQPTAFVGPPILYDSVSQACYRLQFSFADSGSRAEVPGGGFDATDYVTLVGCGACCDFPDDCGGEDCSTCADPSDESADCHQNPPVDPPPDPGPADCGDCGQEVFCTSCHDCEPGYGIRVTLTGLTNCTCVGPCGNSISYEWARLNDGLTFDGTYDLLRLGECDWKQYVAKTMLVGSPGDTGCHVESTTSVHDPPEEAGQRDVGAGDLRHRPRRDRPRLDDAASDDYQMRAFSGSHAVGSFECMTIPAMTNVLGCGCHDTATSDGRFNVATGGTASFRILCST
jgi:hypothetical protein